MKHNSTKRLAAILAAGSVLTLAATTSAFADVSVRQHLKPSSFHCGSNERITGQTVHYGFLPTKQHAEIYRNCSGRTVHKKADVIFDRDGSCISVPAGTAVVLHVVQALPSRTVYRAAKSC